MPGIHTLVSDVFAEVMQHVAVVMQEAAEHERIRFTVLSGKLGGLQSVLLFTDTFAVVTMSAFAKNTEDLRYDLIGMCRGGFCHGLLLSLITTAQVGLPA
jgi:hypothetical protein